MGFWQFATGGGSGGGSGDIVGPASATDFGIAYFDDTTGKLLAGSAATITAAGSLTIPSAETIEFSTDTGLARSAAGVVKVTDGSTGLGGLLVRGNSTNGIFFNGTTSGDVALLRNSSAGTQLRVLLGDQSQYGSISAKEYYSNGGSVAQIDASGRLGVDSTQPILWWDSFPTTSTLALRKAANYVLRIDDGTGSGIASLLSSVLVEANTATSGTPNALAATESGTVFTNEGTTAKNYHTLPTAAAGYVFEFVCQDADGIRITANTDDTIRVIDKVTAAAGYIESTTIGSVVRLVSINAVEWYATSIHGVWTDGTFTYDDTSLTTP